MIIVILIISLIALFVGVIVNRNASAWSTAESIGFATGAIGGCIAVISAGALIILGGIVSELKVIDEKIEMYEAENTKIETQIADVVEGYQQYETDIFASVSPDSAITIVSLYPELKSDTLVQSQIEIYTANNQKIKELKEQKIDGEVYRWWLYFGG